jgi:hypothetical protein
MLSPPASEHRLQNKLRTVEWHPRRVELFTQGVYRGRSIRSPNLNELLTPEPCTQPHYRPTDSNILQMRPRRFLAMVVDATKDVAGRIIIDIASLLRKNSQQIVPPAQVLHIGFLIPKHNLVKANVLAIY